MNGKKIHNEEFHDLYSSPSIIRIIEASRIRWAGHEARMGRGGTCTDCWWKSQRKGGYQEDQDIGSWIRLEWIL
jgi:hypothetical protein